MGGPDKAFSPLVGVPLLARTVQAFLDSPLVDDIIIVLRQERLAAGQHLAKERGWPGQIRLCVGLGPLRQDSVRAGLEQIVAEGWVLVHDGARPLVRPALIARGLAAATTSGAAVPGLPVADTIKLVSERETVEQTLPRARLRAIQTPQVFRLTLIRQAHHHFADSEQAFTDDAAMLEALGHPVQVFPGDPDNIKVTLPGDIQRAEALWHRQQEQGHG